MKKKSTLQFSDNVQVIMDYYHMNQTEFAKFLGTVNQKTISSYVSGKNPNLETVIQVAKMTGLSLDAIVFSKISVENLPTLPIKNYSEVKIVAEPLPVYAKKIEKIVCSFTGGDCSFREMDTLREENKTLKAQIEKNEINKNKSIKKY